jgi:hypothetical protein
MRISSNARAALLRVIADADYRAAVQDWITSKTMDADESLQDCWIGKRDAAGAPVMNICTGGDPVTVPISIIRYVIAHGQLPDSPD